jgi:hypothetical protein
MVEGMGWINLPQDMNYRQAVADAVMNLLILYGTVIFLTSWRTISFLIRAPLIIQLVSELDSY